MKKIIAGNFKMNKTLKECEDYLKLIKKYKVPKDKKVIVCPPVFAVNSFSGIKNISVGAQNVATSENGAYTGEISASQLKSLKTDYCLVGHSERRNYFNESDNDVNTKAKMLETYNIMPIICIGEKLEEISKKKYILKNQIKGSCKDLNGEFIVAYEPVWAIGTGKTCELNDIEKTHKYIKEVLFSLTGKDIKVLYGGSVKPDNASIILGLDVVDGVLVGGACLDFSKFSKIIES